MGGGIILAGAGGVFLPFGTADGVNPKVAFNSELPFLVVQGVFLRPGLLLMALGAVLILIASLLPRK